MQHDTSGILGMRVLNIIILKVIVESLRLIIKINIIFSYFRTPQTGDLQSPFSLLLH